MEERDFVFVRLCGGMNKKNSFFLKKKKGDAKKKRDGRGRGKGLYEVGHLKGAKRRKKIIKEKQKTKQNEFKKTTTTTGQMDERGGGKKKGEKSKGAKREKGIGRRMTGIYILYII
ncbi:hypothetical protein, unlikely [Trypanosoma brucei gambiense DAL972]|uniref:Uncharacterized protein n=1 Tax=Trypanosoma brucei gambiense (strain MHOM/CI/86/DAL972) TaxID=679716 RepID=D0A4X8_TRYB9|nr:hypothetical protein, unlikely [Trypanosoma brucei gambiense DAL972]CBH16322.1 hypothetical protein, unlikely [Trypanosoma brucei gambiense DAL972]|eukprot:XP_011778586.1 hypothetical protein, unlikely [Trypanosoma brucei gambiense DAL972]